MALVYDKFHLKNRFSWKIIKKDLPAKSCNFRRNIFPKYQSNFINVITNSRDILTDNKNILYGILEKVIYCASYNVLSRRGTTFFQVSNQGRDTILIFSEAFSRYLRRFHFSFCLVRGFLKHWKENIDNLNC